MLDDAAIDDAAKVAREAERQELSDAMSGRTPLPFWRLKAVIGSRVRKYLQGSGVSPYIIDGVASIIEGTTGLG